MELEIYLHNSKIKFRVKEEESVDWFLKYDNLIFSQIPLAGNPNFIIDGTMTIRKVAADEPMGDAVTLQECLKLKGIIYG